MDRNIVFPRAIRYLLAVAEHQSFTGAAKALYVSQPTLSQQIRQLEDLLNTQLLDRSGRSVRLTAAGEIYLHHARRALGELEMAKRSINELNDLSRGTLRLGMTPITDYLTTSLLDEFHTLYPGIAIQTLEMPQDAMVGALDNDEVDIGIAFSSTLTTQDSSDEVDSHLLFVEALSLVVGRQHPLYGNTSTLSKNILEETKFILFSPEYALRRHINRFCMEQGVSPPIIMETGSLMVIIEIVRLGQLATIIPKTIAQERHGLHALRLVPELPRHTVSMICRRGAHKSPACRAFGELAVQWSQQMDA